MRPHCALGIALLIVVSGRRARADGKDACATASEHAQELRAAGKLVEARQELLMCSRTDCPSVVKQDCDQWLTAVDASLPSVVVVAHDPSGHDTVNVKVFVDGMLVTTKLNGLGMPLNPGVHSLRFELAQAKPVEQEVLVREGEHGRALAVDFEPLVARVVLPGRTPAPEQVTVMKGGPTPFTYVFGTLAAVALGSFTVFEIKAAVDAGHLRSTCAPACAQWSVDDVSSSTVTANVSLGAAAVFAGVAALLFFSTRDTGATARNRHLLTAF